MMNKQYTILSPAGLSRYGNYHFWKIEQQNLIDKRLADPGNVMLGDVYSNKIAWSVAFVHNNVTSYHHYLFKNSLHYYDHMTGA